MYLALLALGAAIATVVGVVKSRARTDTTALTTFDVHLPPAFERSVLHALRTEKNPAKLRTFGESLLEDYPIAASVLLTRARNLAQPTSVGGFRRLPPVARPDVYQSRERADEAQRVTAAIAADPRLAQLPSSRLARRLQAKHDVVQAVLSSCRAAGHGVVVDPQALGELVGEPSSPVAVDKKHVELALAAAGGKPSARRVLNHLNMQTPGATRAAERRVAQALWAKNYSLKVEPS